MIKEELFMNCFMKVFVMSLILLISVDAVYTQTEKGDKELSIAASFTSRKT